MRIAVVGKGNVGGGLADRWEKAGHDVARIGRDSGDVSDADAVLFAVPGGSIAEAVENVSGLDGKTAVDATNLVGIEPPDGFASNAEFLKSKTGGPTASRSTSTSRCCTTGSGTPARRPATSGAATMRRAMSWSS
jgi:8-hydroxy-5-deazaflavin:NADPH oxidoreductase